MMQKPDRIHALDTEGSLFDKVAQAGLWVFLLRMLEKTLGFVRLIILARILAPNDFGLFGLSLLSLSVMETFSQTGFQTALIQKKEDISSYLDVAWTVSIIRGMGLFAILFLLAPYIAVFFSADEASLVIRLIGLSIFLNGLTNVGVVYFQKELDFKRQFIYQFSITISDFVVAILAAVILRNVWALVFGQLAGGFAGAVVSYFIHPYRPKPSLEMGRVKELFDFGRWVAGSHILTFLITQGDDIFVGKMLGMVPLGFYQMAYKISNMPATEISHVVSKVTFPAYAKMQDNRARLRESYLRVLQLTNFLSFIVAGLILVMADDFTMIFMGKKWMAMVLPLKVLTIAGLMRAMAATTGPLFQAVGKPRVDTGLQMFRLGILALSIYPLTIRLGILGASLSVLSSITLSYVGFAIKSINITGCSWKDILRSIIFPLVNTLIVVLLVYVFKNILWSGVLSFFISILSGVVIYLLISKLMDRLFDYGSVTLIKDGFQSLKSGLT